MSGSDIKKLKSDINNYQAKSKELSNIDKCFRRIVILSNYRERCQTELKKRLVDTEKFDLEDYEKAIEKAKKYDIVNDDRYAEIYCFSKISTNRGNEGIKNHLKDMRIDWSNNQSVIEMLNKAEKDEFKRATSFLNHHPSKSKNLFQSYLRKLINRGFSVSLSMQVVSAFLNKD